MNRTTARRLAAALATAAVLSAAPASAAAAAPPVPPEQPPPFAAVFGADLPAVCDFDLRVEATGARWDRVVTHGRTTISRGVGYRVTFTNVEDPARTITFPSTRVTDITRTLADGSTQSTTIGSSVIFLFDGDRSLDSDQDDGPSAAVHAGGVIVYRDTPTIDTLVRVTVQETTDVCAELSTP